MLFVLLAGQQPIPAVNTARDLFYTAQRLWVEGYFDQSYTLSRQAAALARETADTATWVSALRQAGKYEARYGSPEAAAQMLDSVIAMAGWVGPLHHDILLARGERADVELTDGRLEQGFAMYQALLEDMRRLPPDDTLRPTLYQWTAHTYYRLDQYDSALAYGHRSLDLFHRLFPQGKVDVAYVANTLAMIYASQERPDEAVHYLEYAAGQLERFLRPGHSHVIQLRSNLAIIYRDRGLHWQAIDMLRRNLPHLDSIPPVVQFSTLFNYSSSLLAVGDYLEGLRYLDQTEAVLRKQPTAQPRGLGMIAFERAAAYESLRQYDTALYHVRAAIDEDMRLFGQGHPKLILDYLRQGTIYHQQARYAAAVASMQVALDIATRHLPPNAMYTGWGWESMGQVYLDWGDAPSALRCFRNAIRVFRQGHDWNLTATYCGEADAWRLLGQPDSSLARLQQAWAVAMPDLPFQSRPDSRTYAYWLDIQFADLMTAQAAYMMWRYEASRDTAYLDAALACHEAYVAAADSQRQYFQHTVSQQNRVVLQRQTIGQALALCDTLYRLRGDPDYVVRAFYLVEHSKAKQLRDHFRGRQALRFAGVPDSLVEREQYYSQRLIALQGPGDTTAVPGDRQETFRLYEAYRQFLHRLEQQYPAYYRMKYADRTFSIARMQARLQPGQVAYSYFWDTRGSYVFRITADTLAMHRIAATTAADLPAWLAFLSQPPGSGDSGTSGTTGATLGRDLLPDLGAATRQLLIIPDGMLGYLPFESLLTDTTTSDDYRQWPYLVRQWPVTYVYAAENWVQQTRAATAPAAYLGMAPAFGAGRPSDTRTPLGPLRYNEQEVAAVAQVLGSQAHTGGAARESLVKGLGMHPHILHFATHAIADETAPMQSRLYLAGDSTDGEDGVLFAHELYGLQLSSPLTVLSACQTGRGPVFQGEGVMSLARAFRYAGSERIITTLWQTDDRAGADLIEALFAALAAGQPVEEALRQARLDWLRQADGFHAHPYYWAGWVLIGDGGAIPLRRTGWYGYGIAALLLLVAAGGWWLYRRRTARR
ncbi:MAG: hypothetical protein OHK0039_43200 [Bacteroidia bacterium]